MAPRRALALAAALLLVVSACGDDDGGDAADRDSTTTVTSVDADAGDDGTDPGSDDDPTTTTTTVPDAEAEDPPGGSADDPEGAADDFVYVADLSGDGSGRAELQGGDDGELCADIEVSGLGSAATDAHVHESQDGEVVVELGRPTATEGGSATWDHVCVPVDDAVEESLAVNAPGFHVDVHTGDEHGEVQGPLAFATIFDLELS